MKEVSEYLITQRHAHKAQPQKSIIQEIYYDNKTRFSDNIKKLTKSKITWREIFSTQIIYFKLLKYALKYTKMYWKQILLSQIFITIQTLFITYEPILEGKILDIVNKSNGLTNLQKDLFISTAKIYILMKILKMIINPLIYYYQAYQEQSMICTIKADLFEHMIKNDIDYFGEQKQAELYVLFTDRVRQLRNVAIGQDLFDPIQYVIRSFGSLYLLFTINFKISSLLLLLVPFYLVIEFIKIRLRLPYQYAYDDMNVSRANTSNELFANIMAVQSMSGERREIEKYKEDMKDSMKIYMKQDLLLRVAEFMGFALDTAKFIIILYYGGSKILFGEDNLTIGNLSTFLTYSGSILNLYETFRQIWILIGYNQDIPQLLKVFDAISYMPSIQYNCGKHISNIQGQIEFSNVVFSYKNRDAPILKKISFIIEPGQYVAFAGMSGHGKSTIAKLVQRFYDPIEGSVKIDGMDLRDINIQDYRQMIGYVQQESKLFNNTIEYNIIYTAKEKSVDYSKLVNVCKIAGCYDFIMDKSYFPSGFQTKVGVGGALLSGGQVQRIAIARALMKEPKVLILDEATSQLDSVNEHLLLQNIEKLVISEKKMTIIVIAHRLSSIINCEKIFVLKEGQIIEEGTHQQLIDEKGYYSELIKHQL